MTAQYAITDDFTSENSIRQRVFEYDELDRMTTNELSTDEATWDQTGDPDVVRTFGFDPDSDWVNGTVERTGPDGQTTTITFDDAGRRSSVDRDGMTISYGYDTADRLISVGYPSGLQIVYGYDDAGRRNLVHHKIFQSSTILKLEYTYSADGLVTGIAEYDSAGLVAQTSFTYDNRNRLIEEVRDGDHEYDLTYAYDDGGNRLSKVDAVNNLTTLYYYDIDDPDEYGSNNNRLMYYEVQDGSSQVIETVWYAYNAGGHVQEIVRKPASGGTYYRTFFLYDKGGQLWIALKDQWSQGLNEGK